MTSEEPVSFWSYTHRDNALEGGRIRRLADAIANEYELFTANRLAIFVDSSQIEWGDEWKEVVDNALSRTAFFIAIITPLYLRSEQCRREFIEFVGRATSVDARELVLPILYVDTPEVADESTTDEVARIVRQIQYEDWRSLRLADEASPEYRAAVNKLAKRLSKLALEFADRTPVDTIGLDLDDTLGSFDQIVRAEENVQSWLPIFEDLGEAIVAINTSTEQATQALHDSDRRGGGARGRLAVLTEYAKNIATHAEHVNLRGSEFGRSIIEADPGMQTLIRAAKTEGLSPEEEQQRDEFFGQVKEAANMGITMADSLRGFVESIDGVQSLSRVIRTPLKQLRNGLSAVIDGATVLNSWARLIDQTDQPLTSE
jgi:TIR domain-containing protein